MKNNNNLLFISVFDLKEYVRHKKTVYVTKKNYVIILAALFCVCICVCIIYFCSTTTLTICETTTWLYMHSHVFFNVIYKSKMNIEYVKNQQVTLFYGESYRRRHLLGDTLSCANVSLLELNNIYTVDVFKNFRRKMRHYRFLVHPFVVVIETKIEFLDFRSQPLMLFVFVTRLGFIILFVLCLYLSPKIIDRNFYRRLFRIQR